MKRALVAVALLVVAYGVNLQTRPPAPLPIPMPAPGGDETAALRGRAVYARYGCAACHKNDGTGGVANTNAETDGKVPGVTFVAEGFTRGELGKKILEGLVTIGRKDPNGPRPPFRMPGWAGQMTDAEVADLVEYLFSLYPKSAGEKWR
jgi:mono/diheme cytochrome c family protein